MFVYAQQQTYYNEGDDMKISKILIIIALLSLFVFVAGCKPKKPVDTNLNITAYNNYSFIQISDKWLFDYKYKEEVYSKMMYYTPNQLEGVMLIDVNKTAFLENKVYYITLDEELQTQSVVAGTEIATIMGHRGPLRKDVKSGLTFETENVPKITCGNVTSEVSVLLFRIGNETKVENVDGCYIFTAPEEEQRDFIKLANKFIYTILDVME